MRPSRGNFFEAGVSKRLFLAARPDVTQFSRRTTNFADDDLLLNTGVSFPIAFDRGEVRGTEVKFDVARVGRWSGFVSCALMRGTGFLPITGGLRLGDEASDLGSLGSFPISQDQRHTLRGRISCQLTDRMWLAIAGSYGCGLPVEFAGDREQALAQYGRRTSSRWISRAAASDRPRRSTAAASAVVFNGDRRRVRVQANVVNLANRLNVINFAGLFSGTALAPPRSVGIRVQVEF